MSTPFEDKNYYTNIRRALVSGFFMQVAKRETSGKTYTTVDNQSVLLHPSTVLSVDAQWVLYNEFVLTTKNYIRTVTIVKPEWLVVSDLARFGTICHLLISRRQDIAPIYYDLDNFKGEMRTALESTIQKMKRREAARIERK
jgi:pre-mRNA-splicing factor ATP-dependent RNA helicase DHX15/PRP43